MTFPSTNPPFARALTEREYTEATPVQTAVLAAEAAGRDLLVSAQTGSGKTIAFGLAIGATLLGDAETLGKPRDPLALIIAPTRELALQVQRELTWLYRYTEARIVSCVGGMDPQQERRLLNAGCHIVVGTPGRLRDHLYRGRLRLEGLKAVVLDEADEMLDLGFREDLEFILAATPEDRRTLLFSATLPKEIVTLARKFQRDAWRIATSAGNRGHSDIEYRVIRIAANDAEHAVVNLLRFYDSASTLVFCNTREGVRHLHATLLERGFSAVSLSGEFSQSERNHALQALRDGKARVCVATDVAARGIDLPSLGLVIHAELPNDAESLQHRSGRTGRAGRKGVSILLVSPARRRRAEILLSQLRIDATWAGPPTAEDIRKLDDERLLQRLLHTETASADDLAMAKVLLEQRTAEEIAAALVRFHRAQLPAPEDVSDPGGFAPRDGRDRTEPRGQKAPWAKNRGGDDGPSTRPSGPMVWFRLNVGRAKKADPKWLIPEICRQGGITKREIGAIRILDQDTKFEIVEQAAASFAEKVAKVTKGEIRIEPGTAPAEGEDTRAPRQRENKPFAEPPGRSYAKAGPPHWQKKRSQNKPHGNKPHGKPGKKSGSAFHKGKKSAHTKD